MIKKLFGKREHLLISVILLLFISVSGFSMVSLNQLEGNARVINYAGIVRGATQRLVKKEIQGHPDDGLTARLDSIIDGLIRGGTNNLIALPDKTFQEDMSHIDAQWALLKEAIREVRGGGDVERLYSLSETYFELADKTVSSAELYSEKQLNFSRKLLLGVNVVFILFMAGALIYYLSTLTLRRHARHLNEVAYVDGLTQMPNRASCEREILRCASDPPAGNVAVLMFDMNNLKTVNDLRGHQGGDRLIAEFGKILRTEAKDFGFVGRYGGDEFLGIFKDADPEVVEKYLAQVNMRVVASNLSQVDDIDKISFAVGYCVGARGDNDLDRLIAEADRRMYGKKRQMKENKNSDAEL
ncbi:MAG: diguanylate cyclase [Synergistaceae bacterium]|nr:diguanylate cyclase [Synergistaceae bacterium]